MFLRTAFLRTAAVLVVGLAGVVVPVSSADAPLEAMPAHRQAGPPRPPLGPITPQEVSSILSAAVERRIMAGHPGMGGELAGRLAGLIVTAAEIEGLDPWLIYSVIKVESGFVPESRGAAGERGLMQILPATARSLVRELKWEGFDEAWLETPEVNIRLGSFYLATLMRAHGGDPAAALTAYNTGRPVPPTVMPAGCCGFTVAARASRGPEWPPGEETRLRVEKRHPRRVSQAGEGAVYGRAG